MPNEQIENPIQAFESQHIVDFGKQISDGMDYICRNEVSEHVPYKKNKKNTLVLNFGTTN